MTPPPDSTHPADPSDVVTIEQQLAAACQSLERERMENQRLREDISRQTTLLDEILLSTAWKLTAPLRHYGKLRQKVTRVIHALPAIAARTGGWRALTRITYQAWRRRGSAEVLLLAHNQVGTVDAPGHPAAVIIDPEPAIDCPSSVASDRPVLLFISHEASRTGAPVFLLGLIDYLAAAGEYEPVILLGRGGELESDFRKRGTTFVLNEGSDAVPTALAWLKNRDVRLVYSNTITNGILQRRLRALRCPILCHVHELAYSIDHYFDQAGIQQVMESTSLFLAGSRAVADYLVHQRMRPANEVVLAYPFIDVEQNRRAAASARATSLDLPDDTFVIGACGMLGWRKGTDLFVQVARLVLAHSRQPVHFVWVGGAITANDLQQLRHDTETLGISSRMLFTGPVKAHLPYLARFDVFLLTSREDPFPLVAMDAASFGVPIICFSGAGGAPELVEEDAGIIVPYLDCEEMATAVCRLHDNPDLRRRLGDRARKKVMERHDISVGGQHIYNIIKQQIGHSPGNPQ